MLPHICKLKERYEKVSFFKVIKERVSSHSALFIMAFGGGLSFIISVLLKKFFSDEYYSEYVIFMVFFSYSAVLSTLCSDQLYLRFFDNTRNQISLSLVRNLLFSSLMGTISMIVLSVLLFNDDYKLSLIFSIISPFIILIPQYFRLKEKFNISAVMSHAWKIILLFLIIINYFFKLDISIILLSSVSFLFPFLFFLIFIMKNGIGIKIISGKNDDISGSEKLVYTQIGFFLSFISVASISNVDKIILNYIDNPEILANYAYSFFLLTYPVTLVSNYFGFKGVIEYKKKTYVNINIKIIESAFFILAIYLLTSTIVYMLKDLVDMKWNWWLFSVFLLYSVIKGTYSQISSLVVARVGANSLMKYNILTILVIIFSSATFISYGVYSSEIISVLFIFLWTVRWTLYYILAKRLVNV